MRTAVERFVDGEVSPDERWRVLVHLRHCRRCRAGALFLVELRSALRRRRYRDPVMLAGARLRRNARRAERLVWPTNT